MTPPLVSLAILNTTNFASYNYFRRIFGAQRGWDWTNFCAGVMGAPFGSTISTVEHMIKTQMQLDNIGDKRFRGSFHCLTTIVKERGWSVVYTGHFVNTAREGVSSKKEFPLFLLKLLSQRQFLFVTTSL